MNVKQWALFFLVTLSVNYVSATYLPFGGRHRGLGRDSGVRWNNCNKRMHGFLRSNINGFRRTFQSKYGGRCHLGDNESDQYTLRNVKGKGFADFTLGDTCQYYVRDDGRGVLSFAISFEKIVASFVLTFTGAVGGVIGEFAEAIFGIIGHFVHKFLQIIFPSFLCDIVVSVDSVNGFSLSEFNVRRPKGDLGFLGDLAEHEDIHGRGSFLFEPLLSFISKFLVANLKPFLELGIGKWDHDEDFLAELGLDLRGRSDGGIALGGSRRRDGESVDEESGDKESGDGGYGESRGEKRKLGYGESRNRNRESRDGGYEESRRGNRESGDEGYGESRRGNRESGDGGYEESGDLESGSRDSRYSYSYSYGNEDDEEDYD